VLIPNGVSLVKRAHGHKVELKGVRLQNQEIWLAYPKLKELAKTELPVEVSIGIARLIGQLQMPYAQIETTRRALVTKYGKEDKNHQINVDSYGETAGDFALEFGELLHANWPKDIHIERVKLPLKVSHSCPECGHEMELSYLIDPQILVPLVEHFVEVEPA